MDEHNGGKSFGQGEELSLGLARRAFGAPSIAYLQGVADGRHKAVQTVLEDIIGGSTSQGVNCQFFPADTRDKNERNVRALLPDHGQRLESVEAAQLVIGQNQVRPGVFDGLSKSLFGVHALCDKANSSPAKLPLNQFSISRRILQQQDKYLFRHNCTAQLAM